MLHMIGYGENVGSGFPTIISAWKDAKWEEPDLKNKIEVDEVELVLPITNKGNRDANDTINDTLNDDVSFPEIACHFFPDVLLKRLVIRFLTA